MLPAVRAAVAALDPELVVYRAGAMTEVVGRGASRERFALVLMGAWVRWCSDAGCRRCCFRSVRGTRESSPSPRCCSSSREPWRRGCPRGAPRGWLQRWRCRKSGDAHQRWLSYVAIQRVWVPFVANPSNTTVPNLPGMTPRMVSPWSAQHRWDEGGNLPIARAAQRA
jgi:hypothetical protein